MLNGTKVIFNSDYVEEVERHTNLAKKKYEVENMPQNKARLKAEYEAWEKKLEWSINFQDTVDFVQNMEVPSITVCKLMSGLEIPAKHLQRI